MRIQIYSDDDYLEYHISNIRVGHFMNQKFKGPAKSFGYRGMKLLAGIRVIAEGLAQRPRPEPPTRLELHLFKLTQR